MRRGVSRRQTRETDAAVRLGIEGRGRYRVSTGIRFLHFLAALNGLSKRVKLVAAQPEASAFLYTLYNGGTQAGVVESPTLADGLTGAVEDGSLTIPLARQYIQQFVLVTEDENRARHGVCLACVWTGARRLGGGFAGGGFERQSAHPGSGDYFGREYPARTPRGNPGAV